MPTAKKTGGIEPLPRYTMPDASAPPYEEIMRLLREYHRSPIGSSYYYVRAAEDFPTLCRIIPGTGKIFFHEIVDHEQHGISQDELQDAVAECPESYPVPGCYPISSHIEAKLRALMDFS